MEAADELQATLDDRNHSGYAINSHYVAFAGHQGVHVRSISPNCHICYIPYDTGRSRFKPLLAFSPVRLNLLAVANGAQVLVYNIKKRRARCVLKGNGRIISSVAFSGREPDIISTGSVDGSICLWSTKIPSLTLRQLSGIGGPCDHVAVHSIHADLVAACHLDKISVWSLRDSLPYAIVQLKRAALVTLGWRSGDHVVAAFENGELLILRFPGLRLASGVLKRLPLHHETDQDTVACQELRGTEEAITTYIKLGMTASQVTILGQNGVIVLPLASNVLYFYSYSIGEGTATELWRLQLSDSVDSFSLRHFDAGVEVIALAPRSETNPSHTVPMPVLDAMGWTVHQSWPIGSLGTTTSRASRGKMVPATAQKPKSSKRHSKFRPPASGAVAEEIPRKQMIMTLPERKFHQYEVPPPSSVTSSLELPKKSEDDNQDRSPMPFLSPVIPARSTSPGPLTPLGENTIILPRASFDSIASSATTGHDSDSDDETFAGNLQHSASFLPGGVNVPLPRTCGAAFCPNGQLLTFFPSLPRPSSSAQRLAELGRQPHDRQTSEVVNLFPGFGNFVAAGTDPGSGTQSPSHFKEFPQATPKFLARPSPLETRPSWSAKVSSVKVTAGTFAGPNNVSVSVRNPESLTPTRATLGASYRLCVLGSETAADLCYINSKAAAAEGLPNAAETWCLLAIILEQKSVLGYDSNDLLGQSPTAFIEHRPLALWDPSPVSSLGEPSMQTGAGVLQSLQHPLGPTWAVEQLFAWLEDQADIQLLACASALLTTACKALRKERKPRATSSQSSDVVHQFSGLSAAVADAKRLPPDVPLLRADSSALANSGESPSKSRPSQTSSRNTSQPTTPYLESSASTPPFPLSTFSKRNTRISNSGSASPEYHRSSFSIAAKSYAASIAEKFSSYGSSPPTKKLSNSPGNELSSSLPVATAPGSWSKSVSFASTIESGRASDRSLSLAQEDDNYDSDRTVDDSLPHTPRTPNAAGVIFKMKPGGFFDEMPFHPVRDLMPESIAAKGHLWRKCYAEQLRSWDLIFEAAELEKLAESLPNPRSRSPSRYSTIVCQSAEEVTLTTCSLCYCVIRKAKLLCPSCLHTAHPDCLDQFVSGDDAEDHFACPTGCGCNCTAVKEIPFGLVQNDTLQDGS